MSLPDGFRIRAYREGDAPALCRLFFDTVRTVNRMDYTTEQVTAWAPEIPDAEVWHRRMARQVTLVAEDATGPLGFVELDGYGLIDMLYCRADAVRRGIGSALYREAEARALRLGLTRLTTHASLTARPFFERMGFRVVKAQTVERKGAGLRNFVMEKVILPEFPRARPGPFSRLRRMFLRWLTRTGRTRSSTGS